MMFILRVDNSTVLSHNSLQILRQKKFPGKYNIISPLNRQAGYRTLAQPLPTDLTRGFDFPPEIPQFLSSISTLNFIGFTWPSAELIWTQYVVLCSKPLPLDFHSNTTTSGQAAGPGNEAKHYLLHVAKTHVRTKTKISLDIGSSVDQVMASIGLVSEMKDAVMNYAMDQLGGLKGAEKMLQDTANVEGWIITVIEKRWFSLVDLDRLIIAQRGKEG